MAVSSSEVLRKVPRRIIRLVINAKKRSTWLSQELLVGVKWNLNRLRWPGLSALDFGTFVRAVVIHEQVNFQIRW